MPFDTIFANALTFAFWQKVFVFVKWLFIAGDIFLLFGIIYLFRRASEYCLPFVSHKRIPYLKGIATPRRSASQVSMRSEWSAFVARASAAQDESLPLLIIEADKLVDEALKRYGFPGDTMLERIQALARSRKMRSLEAFWRAHKTRNEIAHSQNFLISRTEVERHLGAYQRFLKELGCL